MLTMLMKTTKNRSGSLYQHSERHPSRKRCPSHYSGRCHRGFAGPPNYRCKRSSCLCKDYQMQSSSKKSQLSLQEYWRRHQFPSCLQARPERRHQSGCNLLVGYYPKPKQTPIFRWSECYRHPHPFDFGVPFTKLPPGKICVIHRCVCTSKNGRRYWWFRQLEQQYRALNWTSQIQTGAIPTPETESHWFPSICPSNP